MQTRAKSETTQGGLKEEASPAAKKRELVRTGGKIEECSGSIIWLYMQQEHALTVEQLVQLRRATIPAQIRGKPGTLVRIFAPDSPQAKGITVKDFDALDNYAGLILYDGYYFKRGGPGEILIEKRTGKDPSLLERELQDGSITEVGMKEEASGAIKWLKPFGSFLLRGGWLVVFFLVIVIIVAISALMK